MMSTGLPLDQVGGSTAGRAWSLSASEELGGAVLEIGEPVGGEHASAAAVGEDREALARKPWRDRQHLGGLEQLIELGDAQEPHGGTLRRRRRRSRRARPYAEAPPLQPSRDGPDLSTMTGFARAARRAAEELRRLR